jgi:hypothetical protein
MRERVRRLAGVGVPQHDIAAIIECDEKTLRKHFQSAADAGTHHPLRDYPDDCLCPFAQVGLRASPYPLTVLREKVLKISRKLYWHLDILASESDEQHDCRSCGGMG